MGIENIKPSRNHLVVKPIEDEEEVTKDGFILPKNFHQKPMKAEVVSIAEEPYDSALTLSVGSVVLLPKYGATKVLDGGETYHLCHVNDVIGVV